MSSNRIRSVNWSGHSASLSILSSNNVEISKRSRVLRSPKTKQEKVLCYALCFLFIMMMVFLASLCIISERWKATLSKISYSYKSEDEICDTEACKETAEKLLSNLDPSTDPCVDFYQYACGGWMENHPIPDNAKVFQAFSIRNKDLGDILLGLLNDSDSNITEPKAVASVRKFYRGCKNREARYKVGVEPLVKLLKDFGGWPMLEGDEWNADDYSWYKYAAEANRKLLVDVFIQMYFSQDLDDNKVYNIVLKRGNYFFKEYYEDVLHEPESNVSRAVIDSIVDAARVLGSQMEAEKLREEARKLITFEYGLFLTGRKEGKGEQNYHIVSIGDLEENSTSSLEIYKSFTYKEFLNLLLRSDTLVTDETSVYIQSYYYFEDLPSFIDSVDSRILANYVAYTIMDSFAAYTVEDLWTLILNDTRDRMETRYCATITNTFMSFALSRLYIDKHFTPLQIYHMNKMVEMIRLAYSSTLDQNTWMDKETMLDSLVKLQSMDGLIGYPKWIADDALLDKHYEKVLEVEEDDYFGAVVKLCEILGDAVYLRWNKTVQRNETYTGSILIVNAFYMPRSNIMVLPAGILGYPFYKFNRIDSINYGGIGTVIGHEISHAFDARGRHFDHEGNLKNWWTNGTKGTFLAKARCFAEQYENFVEEDSPLRIDGNYTLSENIADNGAIRNAFKAFRLHLALSDEDMTHRKTLPGLPATPEQLFFLGHASIWCANTTEDYARRLKERDKHSPSKLRVNIPLANFKEFARAFKCNPGTPMNPLHKCVLW